MLVRDEEDAIFGLLSDRAGGEASVEPFAAAFLAAPRVVTMASDSAGVGREALSSAVLFFCIVRSSV